jgi:hypothetical protein
LSGCAPIRLFAFGPDADIATDSQLPSQSSKGGAK